MHKLLILFFAGLIAGILNALAGGGTLISFPALMFTGVPSIIANATNTVALQVGTIASLWSYRREFATQTKAAWRYGPLSAVGGLLGAVLLLHTGEGSFRAIVPYLILFATLLFTLQPFISRWLRIEAGTVHKSALGLAAGLFFQFCVSIYGGYFGAGIGILMLAALGFLVQGTIYQVNSLKVLLAGIINGVAAIYFIAAGSIFWTDCLLVTLGAIVGGYFGPSLGRKMGARAARGFVSVVGFVVGFYFLFRR